MQIEFSSVIQQAVDASESEMQAQDIWKLFEQTYLNGDRENQFALNYINHSMESLSDGSKQISLVLSRAEQRIQLIGQGNGTLDAAVNALGNQLQIISYEEKAISSGADAMAISIIECQSILGGSSKFGVGRHSDITIASLLALLGVSQRLGLSEISHPKSSV